MTTVIPDKVFISYAEEDSSLAVAINDELDRRRFQPWIYENNQHLGERVAVTAEHVADSAYFALILTRHSLNSDFVYNEFVDAIAQKKRIFAVLDGFRREDIRGFSTKHGRKFAQQLSDLIVFPFYGSSGAIDAANAIAKSIDGQPVKIPPPPPSCWERFLRIIKNPWVWIPLAVLVIAGIVALIVLLTRPDDPSEEDPTPTPTTEVPIPSPGHTPTPVLTATPRPSPTPTPSPTATPTSPPAVTADPALCVTPASPLEAFGEVGGPFTPPVAVYTLENCGGGTLVWEERLTTDWIGCCGTNDRQLLQGETVEVTVTVSDPMVILAPGDYFDEIVFTNTTNGAGNTSRQIALSIPTPCTPGTNRVYNGCNLGGVSWAGQDLSGSDFSGAVSIDGLNLTGATLVDADFTGLTFNNVNLANATLTDATLVDTDLSGPVQAVITGADFTDADLTDAVLSGAVVDGTKFERADLSSAQMNNLNFTANLELSGATVALTNFNSTDLTTANLSGVTWNGTHCPDGTNSRDAGGSCQGHLSPPGTVAACNVSDSESLLADCDLSFQDLTNADLSGRDLTDANLTGAILTGVTWTNATCPDGFVALGTASCFGHMNDPEPPAAGLRMLLDGVDDRLTAANPEGLQLTLSSQWMIETWIQPYADGPAGDRAFYSKFISAQEGDPFFGGELALEVGAASPLFVFRNGRDNIDTGHTLPTDRLSHLAFVADGINFRILVDGHEIFKETQSPYGAGPANIPVIIGGQRPNGFFRGILYDMRVWSIARTDADIVANMTELPDGTEQGLLAAWSLSEGDSSVASDATGQHDASIEGNPEWITPSTNLPINFFVTTTSDEDDGSCGASCSLREAIRAANLLGTESNEPAVIGFAIPGAGPHKIAPTSALPAIGHETIIDGYTQPGSTRANDNRPATLMIEIDGSSAGSNVNGITFNSQGASDSELHGVSITGFSGHGVFVRNALRLRLTGNHVGINGAGNLVAGNGRDGIHVTTSTGTIGGSNSGDRNVVSANGRAGIHIEDSIKYLVAGNYVGLNVTGVVGIGNSEVGVKLLNTRNSDIGTGDPGSGNVISGNLSSGISIDGVHANGQPGNLGNRVKGNLIGTDVTGDVAIGNSGAGIDINGGAAENVIGGADAGEMNLISANTLSGVLLRDGSKDTQVLGNRIGTNLDGTAALGSCQHVRDMFGAAYGTAGNCNIGVFVDNSSDNTISSNLISGNASGGIRIQNPAATGNQISDNTIGTGVGGVGVIENGPEAILVTGVPDIDRFSIEGLMSINRHIVGEIKIG